MGRGKVQKMNKDKEKRVYKLFTHRLMAPYKGHVRTFLQAIEQELMGQMVGHVLDERSKEGIKQLMLNAWNRAELMGKVKGEMPKFEVIQDRSTCLINWVDPYEYLSQKELTLAGIE